YERVLGRSSRREPGLAFQAHLPHVVALADRDALHPQDVVGRGGMEVEVWERERQEESLGRERHLEVAELEDNAPAFERVDLRGVQLLQRLLRVGDELLQPAVVVRRRLRRRLEDSVLPPLDRAKRALRDRLQLEAERQ